MRQRRQIRLDFHLQPLRDAPRSHPAFPPQTQADSHGPASGSRLPARFGLSAAFGALPVRPASTQTVLAHAPAGCECSALVAASALWGAACPSMPGLIPRRQDAAALRRWARPDRCGDTPVIMLAVGR